jgi:hypothetical protein
MAIGSMHFDKIKIDAEGRLSVLRKRGYTFLKCPLKHEFCCDICAHFDEPFEIEDNRIALNRMCVNNSTIIVFKDDFIDDRKP